MNPKGRKVVYPSIEFHSPRTNLVRLWRWITLRSTENGKTFVSVANCDRKFGDCFPFQFFKITFPHRPGEKTAYTKTNDAVNMECGRIRWKRSRKTFPRCERKTHASVSRAQKLFMETKSYMCFHHLFTLLLDQESGFSVQSQWYKHFRCESRGWDARRAIASALSS